MEALAMFSDGPAFFIEADDTNSTIRDALRNGKYKTYIGSVKGGKRDDEESYWMMDDNEKNTKYDKRTYRLGFHPVDEFKDQLSMRKESLETLMGKVIRLEVWSKKGQDVKPLDTLTDNQGRELYHGSILHFNDIPIRFFSRDSLDFWLQARQIQVPSALPDIRSLVNVVWTTLNEKLKPIPKVLMRGRSGYCSPACLVPRVGTTVTYQSGDELLCVIRAAFGEEFLDDEKFTTLFGKRNGTRRRCLMHIQDGSFDVGHIKCTFDLHHQEETAEGKLLVVSAGCSPSQKLKENNKEKFYNLQLAVELDDQDHFKRFMTHPATCCSCPNGCIICAHLGGLILLLFALCRFNDDNNHNVNSNNDEDDAILPSTSFEVIRSMLPTPINELLQKPMPSTFAFPRNGSEKKEEKNQYRKIHAGFG